MGRWTLLAMVVCAGASAASAQSIVVVRFIGEVISNDLVVGDLATASIGEPVEFDFACDAALGFEAPWGPATMLYPIELANTELRATASGTEFSFVPPASQQGESLIMTSGVTPGATDKDLFDLPRIVMLDGVYSMRLLASDAESTSFNSADLSLLPPSSDAGTFEDSIDDIMIWRIDGASDDPRVRPGTMHIRLLEYQMPIECEGDLADDLGTLGSRDGTVSFGDFLALLGLIGPCPGGLPGCAGDLADDFGTAGGDGMVSFGDFLFLLSQVGAICR